MSDRINHTNTDWPPPPATVIVEHGRNRTWSEIAGMVAFALMCLCALNLLIAALSMTAIQVWGVIPVLVMMVVGLPAGAIGLVIGIVSLSSRWGGRAIILAIAIIVAGFLVVAGMVVTPPHNPY